MSAHPASPRLRVAWSLTTAVLACGLFLAGLALAGPGHPSETAKSRGSLFVGGNRVPATDTLRIDGERICAGPIQVWPPVSRSSAPAKTPVVVDAVTQSHFDLSLAARSHERRWLTQGLTDEQIADSLVTFYRSSPLVDSVWIEPGNDFFIYYRNHQREELLLDRGLGVKSQEVVHRGS